MKTKKIGIIGCGHIAQVHSLVIAKRDDSVISVLCDKNEKSIEELKTNYLREICESKDRKAVELQIRSCTDWKELCNMDLDIVHICTPHYLHVPMAVELLNSGKAVFMEKPCAISSEQFEELKRADSSHPGKLGICLQNRFNRSTLKIDELIREGQIGNVIGGRAFVTWRRDEEYYLSSDWKGRLEKEGGGALINQSIHTLDLLLRYLGSPGAVEASSANHHLKGIIDVEDTLEAWLAFDGGKRACFYCSNGYVSDAPVILEIHGEKGRIQLNGQDISIQTQEGIRHLESGDGRGIVKDYWGDGHRACVDEFYHCIDTGQISSISLQSAENTFRTMFRIYESAVS